MRAMLIAHTVVVNDIPDYQPHGFAEVTHADELAEQAGRLCYLSWDRPNPKTADNRGYMRNIIDQGHFSVVEHASATFYIDGVTRNFTHEFIRHRHLSFSEVSQRYVDVGKFDFIVHPGLAYLAGAELSALGKVVIASKDAYEVLMAKFVSQGTERKLARQAARHALLSGTETKIVVTGNMRSWREVLGKRLSPAADAEFQEVARLILAELKRIAPNTFQDIEDPASPTS